MAKEIGIGLMIASTFGITCGFVVYLLNTLGIQQTGSEPAAIGLIVSCGLFVACMTATILGTFSPFFFARIGVDPAVASGPIVTAFNDVASTCMLILVARVVYFLIY
jgi:magnesium transporter